MGEASKEVFKNLIGITEFEGGFAHKRFVESALEQRLTILAKITREEIGVIAKAMNAELVDYKLDEATEWVLRVKPLSYLEIYYFMQKYSPEFPDVLKALYSKEAKEWGIPAEDVSDFTILYANAIIYTAKKVLGKSLPKLSRYL
ncbi:MAG: hypothetical protein QXK12_06720 [Candidatus Nezhaarchaeales archaeon]